MEVRTRFQLIDTLVCSVLFAPFIVLFWHGFFGILDDVILRDSPHTGPWIIITIGIIIQILASIFQDHIHSFVAKYRGLHSALVLTYNFILGSAQILQFRGLNDLYEQYVGVGVSDAVSATLTAVVILCGLRLCSQTVDVPFVLGLDSNRPLEETFKYSGYHETTPGLSRDHVLDAFSSVAVMQTCVHLFAIASWVAVDTGFFKEHSVKAIMASWIGGYALFVLFWAFSTVFQNVSRQLVNNDARQFFARFFVDLMMIGQGLGVVMMWHGHWILYDVMAFWFPISLFGVNYTPYCEVVGAFGLLAICQITSSLVRSGMQQDDVDSCINCIGMNATYFTHFFEEDIKKGEKSKIENNNEDLSEESAVKQRKNVNKSSTPAVQEAKPKRKISLQDLVDLDRKKQNAKKNK